MERKIGIILIGLFLLILMVEIAVEGSNSESKINKEIYKQLEKNNKENISVIVKIKVEEEKGIFIKNDKTKEELEKEKEKIKKEIIGDVSAEKEEVREYGDLISIEVNKKDLKILEENKDIEDISFSHQFRASMQDVIEQVNASTIRPIKISGKNITGIDETVCIIDTGIDFSHSDLISHNKTCVIDCYNKNCIENCSIGDDNGHGTHVGGIVAASGGIEGIGININLIGLKVLDENGNAHSTSGTLDIKNAIDWCIANADSYNISVISMSLGTQTLYDNYCDSSFLSTLTASINDAVANNISVISSTGNDGNITHIASPGCIKNSTAVGSIRKDDSTFNYNRNSLTDLLGVGVDINSTKSSEIGCLIGCSCSGNYMVCSGTSMATPNVAGIFSLFSQFFKLQNNRVPRPSEIQESLNSSGFPITDASTGITFSRVDIYSALISIDNSNPIVNLSSPENNAFQSNQNVSFKCSTRDVKLSNITFYLWNSTAIYNTSTRIITGINAEENFNITNLPRTNYKWNCLAYDHNSNFSFASNNFSLIINNISINLISPLNNSYTNKNQTFNCSAITDNSAILTNLTFYIWNSTNLVYNLTKSLSGVRNSSLFTYNFSVEDNYKWNCNALDNKSDSNSFENNYTITYDNTNPTVSLGESFPENATSSSILKKFYFNSSDNYGIANCSLIINGVIDSTLSNSQDLNLSQTQYISKTLTPGTYNWNINCTDNAGNKINSLIKIIKITAPITSGSSDNGGGGGGGISNIAQTYIPNNEQITSGYTKKLKKDDKIKITFFDRKSEQHTLTMNNITLNSITLIIQSNPTTLVLGIGQSIKLNLTSDNYYDLYIKLNSIENDKADITIQTINEIITNQKKPILTGNSVSSEDGDIKENDIHEDIKFLNFEIERLKLIIYSLIIIILGVVIFILFKEKKYILEAVKKDNLIKHKKVFKKKVMPVK